ncbi:hypothetical protein H312_02992 [Anncaliia algerae PRA339]|uniref:Transcription initiation factor TFIID subunit 9 n=1 Tax=Anncaliia algerae PRA339 TaxID=1288291 RepID=A0A059EY13_9MICR|nr:hypothetical protein H312_02992 [Anncaliia algerae PRA339]
MSSYENVPREAKLVSLVLRTLGIKECEPKVLIQLLEYSYKYSTSILLDAQMYCTHCNRSKILVDDIKLALQTKIGRHFVPPPPRDYINEIALQVNSKPLSLIDDSVLPVPNQKIALFSLDYEVLKKDCDKKRKIY